MPEDQKLVNGVSDADEDTLDLSKMDRGNDLEPGDDEQNVEGDDEQKTEGDGDQKPEGDADVKPRDDKGRFIPAYRAKEMVERERLAREAAELRLAEAEKRLQAGSVENEEAKRVAALTAKADELSASHAEALVDGDAKRAAEAMKQLRAVDRELARIELLTESTRQTQAALESDHVDLAIAHLEAEHPVLNPDSTEFDPSIANFVLAEQRRLVGEGLTPSKALLKAGAEIVARFVAPKPEAGGEKKGLTNMAGDRKTEQVKKNLETAVQQPASLRGVGADSDKLGSKAGGDVSKMSEEEFDALPEATRARMRGDTL